MHQILLKSLNFQSELLLQFYIKMIQEERTMTNSFGNFQERPGVNFMNCFEPYAYLLRLALNFCTSKKLLKSWA